MIRSIERWCVLRQLQKVTDKGFERISHKDLASGTVQYNYQEEFIEFLADHSLRVWFWRAWRIGKCKSRDDARATMINFYRSLFDSCVRNNFISIYTVEGEKQHVHTSSLGDDYVSSYWWEKTLGGAIGTAVIIGALIWFITNRMEKLLKPQESSVQQIQIIPYENPDGIYFKQR